MGIVMRHEARQVPSWLIFDVGQKMNLTWREASNSDLGLLAEWNYQLIRDEGHRNPMTVEELAARMQRWLAGEYRAVVFLDIEPVAYALFKTEEASVYLRQLFVKRDRRSGGIGRAAISILREQIWSPEARLTVDVLSGNPRAIAFYRSVGYHDYCLAMEIEPQRKKGPNKAPEPTTMAVTPRATSRISQ